jgi:histidinol-phosphate phosphatase family protein
LRAFAQFALEHGGAGSLFVHPNDHPFDSDLVEIDDEQRIVAFHPKPHDASAHHPNLVSAALYVLMPVALDFIPPAGASDWGRNIFAGLAAALPLYGYRSCEYIKDVGTPDRLERAARHLRSGRVARLALRTAKPALFLDRDGVINEEVDGVFEPGQVKLIAGAAAAIRAFNDAGIPVICVTNQPGLAKGFMRWEDLRAVGGEIDHHLAEQAGAYLDDILICPHHPEAGWDGEVPQLKIDCDCRKPKDGMLRHAALSHNIDLSRSWLVGDRYCDIAAAHAAGVKSVLVKTGHGGNDSDLFDVTPLHVSADLASAAGLILKALA